MKQTTPKTTIIKWYEDPKKKINCNHNALCGHNEGLIEKNNEYHYYYEKDTATGLLKQVAKIKYQDEAQEFAEVSDIKKNAVIDPKTGRVIDLSGRRRNEQKGDQTEQPLDLAEFAEQRRRYANEAASEIDAFVKNKQHQKQQLKNEKVLEKNKN